MVVVLMPGRTAIVVTANSTPATTATIPRASSATSTTACTEDSAWPHKAEAAVVVDGRGLSANPPVPDDDERISTARMPFVASSRPTGRGEAPNYTASLNLKVNMDERQSTRKTEVLVGGGA